MDTKEKNARQYKHAAYCGDADDCHRYAELRLKGDVIPQDLAEAVEYYRLADDM